MINSNMENMQDILKKYYAKGGKNLFENPPVIPPVEGTTAGYFKQILIFGIFDHPQGTSFKPHLK